LTWMFGWAAFQSLTIFCTAATVGFWKARLWNVSVILPPALLLPPLDELHAARAPVARIAAVAATNVALHFTVCSFFRPENRQLSVRFARQRRGNRLMRICSGVIPSPRR
jgi:hypothetical protein